MISGRKKWPHSRHAFGMLHVALSLGVVPLALGALNDLGLDVEAIVSQELRRTRQLLWVDASHLENVPEPSDSEAEHTCLSSDGPCHMLLQETRAPSDVH